MSEPPSRGPDAQRPDTDSHLPSLGPRGEGWFLLQLVFLAVVLACGVLVGANWTGAPRFAAGVAGAVLMLAGLGLGFRGIRDLDQSLSPLPRPTEDSVLISDGIYRRLRHPIYAGLMLLTFGWSLLTASILALLLSVAFAVLLDLKARREEVWLRDRFPGYAAYAARTRRFVPGLY